MKFVSASLGTATRRYGDIDEFGAGLITFDSSAIGIVEASWVDPKLRSPIELFGTEGQIQVQDGKVRYWSKHVEGADGGDWTDLPVQKPHAFELFWDRLAGEDAELVSVEEAAEESRVMAEMYASAG